MNSVNLPSKSPSANSSNIMEKLYKSYEYANRFFPDTNPSTTFTTKLLYVKIIDFLCIKRKNEFYSILLSTSDVRKKSERKSLVILFFKSVMTLIGRVESQGSLSQRACLFFLFNTRIIGRIVTF